MKCPECQSENPEGMKFCVECRADGWVTKAEKELSSL